MISKASDCAEPAQPQGGEIRTLGDPDRHFWLLRSVARVIGLNLGAAFTSGDLEREAYRAIVNRCRTCAIVGACEDWLASSGGSAAAPPPGCLVAADMERLKRITKTKGAH